VLVAQRGLTASAQDVFTGGAIANEKMAYTEIVRQMDVVHTGFNVAELQTVLRYLHAVNHVR
jgi:hypothetical protein